MVIKRIDFDLSRLKQGFDSPRERQKFQRLRFELEKSSNIRRISVDELWRTPPPYQKSQLPLMPSSIAA
jgi:hypothetical protein